MDARGGSREPDRQLPRLPPPSLAATKAKYGQARRVQVLPPTKPGHERIEPDRKAHLELISLGIERAIKQKEELRLEREVIIQERDNRTIPPKDAKAKKARLDDPGIIRLFDPRSSGFFVYKKCDGLKETKKRPPGFRRDAIEYYARRDAYGNLWCHVKGTWCPRDNIVAVHIVPHFLDTDEIDEILFGSRAPDLRRPGNALLLDETIERWFDSYHVMIVPVDPMEVPITRWRVDVISSDIHDRMWADGPGGLGQDLDGNEFRFRNEERPVSRFMYFHLVIALIRIKDQRPFPTPGNYMRRSMLLALATHFGPADMNVVESWIKKQRFESPLPLTEEETEEAARRVHEPAEEAIAHAERDIDDKSSDEEMAEDQWEDDEEMGEGQDV
ncbi:hypothetical protein B0T24DRAFT_651210 [Lasiosphaeria ovina]|uniref:HNH nuclease domain-containing protein n=1 Tax=Lasiosphaeria ovina TaxID=92902 RepID=A0AAE0JYY1_9PEZI|nr:hypothetical protein B0T24DRAFT_651210 [Lasiosphaeria ovina]